VRRLVMLDSVGNQAANEVVAFATLPSERDRRPRGHATPLPGQPPETANRNHPVTSNNTLTTVIAADVIEYLLGLVDQRSDQIC
jgi:hypothetical protein